MGTFTVPITVSALEGEERVQLDALVDTGSKISCIPGSVLHSLNVLPTETREFELGQGEVREMSVGDIRMTVEGHNIITPVMFNEEGTESLLGAMALERAFLGVDPYSQRLVPIVGLGRSGTVWPRR